MNILLWAPFGCGTHYWGPGRSAFNLYSTGFPNSEHKLFLAHGYPEQPKYSLFENQYDISSLSPGKISQAKFLVKTNYWINRQHKIFDIIHALGMFEYSFNAAYQFHAHGKPSFIKVTSSKGGLGVKTSFFSKLLHLTKRRKKRANEITGYIATSIEIQERLLDFGVDEKRIHLIQNGVDIKHFFPVTDQERSTLRSHYKLNDIFTICYIGGIYPVKRTFEIVKAIVLILKFYKLDEIQLLIVGPDRTGNVYQDQIKAYIKEEKIERYVKFVDFVMDTAYWYQVSDVFILPSISEGMSNSLLEAMATGLGIIVTPVSGSVDLIHNEKNGLYTDGTPESIAQCIFRYADDNFLLKNNGKESRSVVTNNNSTDFILKKHIDLFESAIVDAKKY